MNCLVGELSRFLKPEVALFSFCLKMADEDILPLLGLNIPEDDSDDSDEPSGKSKIILHMLSPSRQYCK